MLRKPRARKRLRVVVRREALQRHGRAFHLYHGTGLIRWRRSRGRLPQQSERSRATGALWPLHRGVFESVVRAGEQQWPGAIKGPARESRCRAQSHSTPFSASSAV